MTELFDRGDRPGAYLAPMLQRPGAGSPAGGAVAVVAANGCSRLFDDVERALRTERTPAIFTPPIYAGDAVAASDPAFAVAALREFVAACLAQSPLWVAP